ncbi:hypothetical protein Harman_41090 [Haloarcula mannanilytica]|uniref:DUF7389 domain-containing protein n=1 Tax=Haloarcula mannanilytica TaxID=2509225 RepID=A0A4C2ENJ7_9EURY|nr:hypothetical protein [Haloarcula mannanilytica]GCF16174.1 hypothetical protein Harman_41090 [Haloarcula mannanilytica]
MSTEQDTEPAAGHDTVEKVERTDTGCSMEAKLDRGTGTRDQDRVRIKAKGETAAETIEEFYEVLAEYDTEISDRLRDIQPERDEEEE